MTKYYTVNSSPSCIWAETGLIDKRIDAHFYSLKYIDFYNKLLQSNLKLKSLYDICSRMNSGPFGSALLSSQYVDEGIPFIRPLNCKDYIVNSNENIVFISEEDNKRLKSSKFSADDLLFTKIGNGIGDIAIVPKNIVQCNISGNLMGVTIKNNIDNYYVLNFLKSDYGQNQIWQGMMNSAKPKIDMETLKTIIIPIPSTEIQKYIGDKVRKAEGLREEAKRLKKEAEEILNNELNSNKTDRFNIKSEYIFINDKPNILYVSEELIDNTRIEAIFYKKEDLEIDSKLVEYKHGYKLLKDICVKITDGTHKTPTYIEKGVTFISSKNILEDEIDFENVKYISQEEHKEISKRCNVEHGDILFTKIGRIGYAKVVPNKLDTFSIFVSVALLKLKEEVVDEYFLEVFLNSEYGKKQSKRLCKGSNQPDFHLEDIGELKIPILPIEIQKEIGDKMRRVEGLKYDVRVLIQEAKQDVEDLIEGNFDMSKIKEIN